MLKATKLILKLVRYYFFTCSTLSKLISLLSGTSSLKNELQISTKTLQLIILVNWI